MSECLIKFVLQFDFGQMHKREKWGRINIAKGHDVMALVLWIFGSFEMILQSYLPYVKQAS